MLAMGVAGAAVLVAAPAQAAVLYKITDLGTPAGGFVRKGLAVTASEQVSGYSNSGGVIGYRATHMMGCGATCQIDR